MNVTSFPKPDPGAILDLAGIGIGPSNLSAAALLEPIQRLESRFFDQKPEFQWHAGMLFPEATLQVSYLKDLVTLVDPTSRFSFLAFLADQRRLYRFSTAHFPRVKRKEFNQYFRWVVERLPNLFFDCPVESVRFERDHFVLAHALGETRSRNVVMACGLTPAVPPCVQGMQGPTLFHAVHYIGSELAPRGKRIAVVGGGQSGAEIVNRLLADLEALPAQVVWVTRRPNFLPIDDSPFANEWFHPPYSEYFYSLPEAEKARRIEEQTLASDGVDGSLLESIYRQLYELELIEQRGKIGLLLPDRSLKRCGRRGAAWELELEPGFPGPAQTVEVDAVILATGFEFRLPPFLDPLLPRLEVRDGRFAVRRDFSIEWDGPAANRLYLQNGARHVRGVADPNLSLVAWRSARIINSLAGEEIYRLDEESSPFCWSAPPMESPEGRPALRVTA